MDRKNSLNPEKYEDQVDDPNDEFDDDDEEPFQETNVGKRLSDLTTKRVISLVLSIMISIPLFSVDTYFVEYTSYQSGAENLY